MKSEIEWENLLKSAQFIKDSNYFQKELQNEDLENVFRRNVVGRAYYASYNKTVEVAKKYLGYKEDSYDNSHSGIRIYLRDLSKRSIQNGKKELSNLINEVTANLESLRQNRNNCDYNKVIYGNLDSMANESIIQAEKIFKLLDNLENEIRNIQST